MNSWNFTGNLGNSAEQKYTQGGDSVVSFSVAVKSGFGDKAVTTWARCSMFGKRGESVLPYLNKGQLVGVCGEMAAREWQDNEGQKRTSIEVRVNDLTLLGKSEGAAPAERPAQSSPRPAAKPAAEWDETSEIPF